MTNAGYGTAASIGAAVGFAALGWLTASGLALVAGMIAAGLGLVPVARTGSQLGAVSLFLAHPLRIAHAVVWCLALVLAALFAKAWGG